MSIRPWALRSSSLGSKGMSTVMRRYLILEVSIPDMADLLDGEGAEDALVVAEASRDGEAPVLLGGRELALRLHADVVAVDDVLVDVAGLLADAQLLPEDAVVLVHGDGVPATVADQRGVIGDRLGAHDVLLRTIGYLQTER